MIEKKKNNNNKNLNQHQQFIHKNNKYYKNKT